MEPCVLVEYSPTKQAPPLLPAMYLENKKGTLQQVNSGYERVEDEKQEDGSARSNATLEGRADFAAFIFPSSSSGR